VLIPILIFGLFVQFPYAAEPPLDSSSPMLTEYHVKAAYLLNFSKFVTWPEDSFAGPDAPFRISVLGEDPFGDVLDRTILGKTLGGRGFRIERLQNRDEVPACHILFICASEETHYKEIFNMLSKRSILTVGEGEDFTAMGGMIGFVKKSRKIRFAINNKAAGRAELKISSKLLRLARTHDD